MSKKEIIIVAITLVVLIAIVFLVVALLNRKKEPGNPEEPDKGKIIMNLKYVVEKEISINQILAEQFQFSTRLKNKLIKNKCVLLNNVFVDTRIIPCIGDTIAIILDSPEDNSNIVPTKMKLDIVYEDEHLLAINKTAGVAVHPSILHFNDSLSNGVKFYFDSIKLKKKIRPINRIDLNTSGLVLFAKNEYVQECLIRQMNSNTFRKTYLCIIDGILDNKKRNSRFSNC